MSKLYPVGVQNFEGLIHDGYVYVDKTAQIYTGDKTKCERTKCECKASVAANQ